MNFRAFTVCDTKIANRSQLTQIDGESSESKPVKIGVPQGSLMGPRLFITYVNDLPDSIRSGEVYMYADDPTIYTVGNTTNEVAITLQVILDQLQRFCPDVSRDEGLSGKQN